jgi:hypothetical protein
MNAPFGQRAWRCGLAGAVLLGITARVTAATALDLNESFRFWEYDAIAASLLRGEDHVFRFRGAIYLAYAPPLWSWCLAGLARVASVESPMSAEFVVFVQVLQTTLALSGAMVLAGVARRLWGERAGWVTATVVCLQPSLGYYSIGHSDPLSLNVFLLALIVKQALDVMSAPRPGGGLLFGAVVGLSVLSRGTPVVALPLLAFLLLNAAPVRARARSVSTVATAAVGMALTILPWSVRNAVVLGTPAMTSTTGENFWRGNNLQSAGDVHTIDGLLFHRALPQDIRNALRTRDEVEQQAAFLRAGLRYWKESPGDAARLYARKVFAFFVQGPFEGRHYSTTARLGQRAVYALETLLAAAALVHLARRREWSDDVTFIAGLVFLIGLLQGVFYVQGRHRFLVEPLIVILGSYWAGGRVQSAKR